MEEFEDNRHDITEILLEVVLNTITLYRPQRVIRIRISCLHTVGQPAWHESSKVKSQSRDFRFIFDEKWRSTLRLKYVGLQ